MFGLPSAAKSFHIQIPVLPEIWQTFSTHTKKNSKITTNATTEPQTLSTTPFEQTLVLTLIQPKINLGCEPFSNSVQQMKPTAGAPIADFFTRLLDIRNQLAGTSQALDNTTIKARTYATLPPEFLTTAIYQQNLPGYSI